MSQLFRTGPTENFTKVIWGLRSTGFVPVAERHEVVSLRNKCLHPKTSHSMRTEELSKGGLFAQGFRARKVILGCGQARCAHTDITFPDFDHYRRESTKDRTKPARETEDQRRLFTYMSYGVGGVIGLYASKTVVHQLVAYKGPAKDQLALANTEINIGDIPEGVSQSFMWRGKPVFVRHRTEEEVAKERSVSLTELRHPERDEDRVLKPEWMVAVGVCTHLGCIPIAGLGEFGGYYCPCHGSHYDTSGRIRKGPAPLNLEVPEYCFKDDSTILVGSSE